jgi:hypothetical protein
MAALKSYSYECGCRFRASESEDTTKCLTCRIIDDLKAGRLQPPASIQRPMDSPAMRASLSGQHVAKRIFAEQVSSTAKRVMFVECLAAACDV